LRQGAKIKGRGIRGGLRGDLRGKESYPPRAVWINELVALDCLIHYKVVEQGQ